MKHLQIIIIFFLLNFLNSFSQTKKETIYLLFPMNNQKTCEIEDGVGNYNKVKKFRIENKKNSIYFYVCDEKFVFNKIKNFKDTCNIKILSNINIKKISYLLNKYESNNEFKHNLFNIFIVEKISQDKIVKYEVKWNDERLGVQE